MENELILLLILMIAAAIFALHARDLLSAIVSFSIVGFALVIGFLLLQAPDLAIVQIVVETISLIIMIAVLIISTRHDLSGRQAVKIDGTAFINLRSLVYVSVSIIVAGAMMFFFWYATQSLHVFGDHTTRMATEYIQNGINKTHSVNLVTGIVFDFRGYDTLGEATILFTAVIGVLTIMRFKGKK